MQCLHIYVIKENYCANHNLLYLQTTWSHFLMLGWWAILFLRKHMMVTWRCSTKPDHATRNLFISSMSSMCDLSLTNTTQESMVLRKCSIPSSRLRMNMKDCRNCSLYFLIKTYFYACSLMLSEHHW